MMDIARPVSSTRRIVPRIGVVAVVLGLLADGAWGVSSLTTGYAPSLSIDRSSVITDVVHRGVLVRSVAASGTFAARRIAIVSSPVDGTVDTVVVRPGAHVGAGTTIATVRNPAIDADIADVRAQIVAAQADLGSVRQQATTARLEREQAVRATQAERSQDQDQAKVQSALHAQGLVGDISYHQAIIKLAEARDRERLQHAETASTAADGMAKIAAAEARIVQLRGMLTRKFADRDALVIRAGTDGTVQSVTAQLGAHATAGSEFARVADQHDLEAMLAVVEGDARSVHVGQSVAIATASGTARGTVVRIDPAANGGTVQVEVALTRTPPGVRMDEHVQAQIELERLINVVYVARPAGAADDTTMQLYKLTGANRAQRVSAALGRGSNDRVVVRSGLTPGDTIIVSDMSAAADHAAVTLR